MRSTYFPLLIASLFFAFFSCKNDTPVHVKADPSTKPNNGPVAVTKLPEENIPTKDGATEVQITDSEITWRCSKFHAKDSHTGTIAVKEGTLLIKNGFVLGGDIVLDMNSIKNTDIEDAGMRAKLEGHLKSPDFFNVKKHPTARFKITQTLPSVNVPDINRVVLGDLTVMGKTESINIPMSLSVTDDSVVAQSANFAINRTRWGINFNSSLLGTVADKIIVDEVMLRFNIKASKE